MPYMVTSTINIPQMLAYIPYMDPMGIYIYIPDIKNTILQQLEHFEPFPLSWRTSSRQPFHRSEDLESQSLVA